MTGVGADDDIPLGERKTVTDFCYLLDKSKQLFNGLRDLPQYGHKQWQSYFGRTFDVYTKLWKFQQQHRQVLDNRYGLKRWQIGEVASKIGQLYYHYYLRTSETSYLNEAFSFYSAIRQRSYYYQVNKEDSSQHVLRLRASLFKGLFTSHDCVWPYAFSFELCLVFARSCYWYRS
ncbi:hypothetical protein PGIGA_G00169170 [Pangasianodon gigas]|uniref:Uncharacterized protein n=1 Tax=Pangasianodon gigas TaxID=30993 RepID=A0ACC5XUQ6_PANGG|nr:hypothetical protein [Pangasianodon gigas]